MLVGGGGYLSQTVVDLVCDSSTLLFLGAEEPLYQILQPALALSQFLVESSILQGTCGLTGQAAEYLSHVLFRQ